ncbi:hypothetical protein ACH0BF_24230 [Pseudobacillus sp. 179-B 2D1 NHS]|uniref:hypothetical protein n=1 Tax=Pseudobacillus sp. 179-B 2D1 NHS TaxID=3374292 RepID=UPI003879A9EF
MLVLYSIPQAHFAQKIKALSFCNKYSIIGYIFIIYLFLPIIFRREGEEGE